MNTSEFISDQKSSIAHLGILFVFLLSIISRDVIPELLKFAVIGISTAIPFLASSIMLFQFEKITTNLAVSRMYVICYAVGHITGVLTLACVIFFYSKIAGVAFLSLSIGLSAIIGFVIERDPTYKAFIKHNKNKNP